MRKETKKPAVDNLHATHMKGDRAYELEKAKKALEKAKAVEAEKGKPILYVPLGFTGEDLRKYKAEKRKQ